MIRKHATMGHDETSKTRRGGTLPQTTRNLEECTREHDERGQQSGWFIPITASGRQL